VTSQVVILSHRLGAPAEEEHRLEPYARVIGAEMYTREQIVANASEASTIILGAIEPFDRATLESLPRLGAVVRRGVGFDNIDTEAATSLGILVANVPDASVNEVADHAVSLLLALERRLVPLDQAVRQDAWRKDPQGVQRMRVSCRRLSDLTLGIVGLGRIGRAVAHRTLPLYRQIVGSDPFVDAHAGVPTGVTVVPLHELLREADHITLHAPLMAGSHHLLGSPEFMQMRPGAILVNTARGGLIDESALAQALTSGHLGGAGLDVTAEEPPPVDHPVFLGSPNILATGHSAAWSSAASAALARGSVDSVVDILSGRQPRSVVNPDVLTSPNLRFRSLRS